MSETTQPLRAMALPTGYGRRKAAGGLRRWWYVAAAVACGAAALLLMRSTLSTWVERLLGRAGDRPAVYTVEPVTLEIALTEDGELKPRESIEIKCDVEGQSTILFVVEESTRVRKGDLLVELASEALVDRDESEQIRLQELEGQLRAAQAELEIQRSQSASDIRKAEIDLQVAELELKKYLNGDYQQRLQSLELDIEQAEMDLQRKKEELEKYTRLAEKGFVTQMDIEERKFALRRAEMTLARHKLSQQIFKQYEHPKLEMQKTSAVERAREELERVKQRAASRVERAEARVKQYQEQLDRQRRRCQRVKEQLGKCKIYAPADGIVQYPSYGDWRWSSERIAAGQKVHEGQTLLVLPDTSQMVVSTRIHEADRHLVREGLPCLVTVPAVPGQTFTGKLVKIDKFAESESRWLNPDLKEHGAEILLDTTSPALSPGDTAQVKILIETVPDVLAVPVQCVFTRGSQSYVFVRNGAGAEPVAVKLGRSNTKMIEVVEGLERGDQVLMHADQSLLAKLPAAPQELAGEEPQPAPWSTQRTADAKEGADGRTGERKATISAGSPAGGGQSAASSDE